MRPLRLRASSRGGGLMVRRAMTGGRAGDGSFRWRGAEVSRLEALSDAVFGFAITLLVVSLEVPHTFAQLMDAMRGFLSFAASFAILFRVWYQQYRFFRRFGLDDTVTVALNAVLLFLVVFFVYPLKFVFTLVVDEFSGRRYAVLGDGSHVPVFMHRGEPAQMMVVFGSGYVLVFVLFAVLYMHAYRLREELELTPGEVLDTADNVRQNVLNVMIGLTSIAVALAVAPRYMGFSGLVYMLGGPVLTANGFYAARRKKRLGEAGAKGEPARVEAGEPAGRGGRGKRVRR
jgi:uncharacterized membrane protein